ncbi:MAG: hypothetical protein JKX76_02070 [Colwellia sp.]|nr:hypothetical protein [Colwellia sp.]
MNSGIIQVTMFVMKTDPIKDDPIILVPYEKNTESDDKRRKQKKINKKKYSKTTHKTPYNKRTYKRAEIHVHVRT